jgi:hypothetical protein
MHVHMDYVLDLALSFMFQSYICFFFRIRGNGGKSLFYDACRLACLLWFLDDFLTLIELLGGIPGSYVNYSISQMQNIFFG